MTVERAALARIVADEGARVLATLIRTTGDWSLAEDAVQDATVRALETWPRTGVPPEPRAWLVLTARRRAIDLLRRERARPGKEIGAIDVLDPEPEPPPVDDDLLRLIFTCCHPALQAPAQVALALRTLCGLTTAEVARALLVDEPTMRRRITRAKQKIAQAGIPYRVPEPAELPARVLGVAATVYFVFGEGFAATAGASATRIGLATEGVRLARLLRELLPDSPTAIGLLALVVLQHARRDARTAADGTPVLLADQDRALWHRDEIAEGVVLVGEGLRRTPARPDRYVVQAAIAACHALAPTADATDWDAIVSWYDVLLTVDGSPVARLGRAVAIGERDGPAAGLAAADAVTGLEEQADWHGVRAVLLARCGRAAEADEAFATAIALEPNAARRADLSRRR